MDDKIKRRPQHKRGQLIFSNFLGEPKNIFLQTGFRMFFTIEVDIATQYLISLV